MGVHGLWQLLQPAGRPVSLESLEGKVLAVDVSIWLHQTMKGMRDKDGNPLPNAHLQGLFSRVCKLLFYRIKPVFVFDGGVPILKKKTLAARKDRRIEAERESSAVAEKLLENLVKSHAVKQALGGGGQRGSGASNVSSGSKPGKVPGVRKGRNQKEEDIFELAPLPESEEINLIKEAQEWEQGFEQQENWIKEGLAALSDTHPDADEFKSLPSEIQHEILRELKERKKYHSLSHLTKMPEDSEDFSSYQLKGLIKKCRLTTRMEEIRKEMTNQTAVDIASQYAGEECGDVKTQFGDQVEARRIVSEDASHYVLIKGISSNGQVEQADRYHLEQTVKVEDVDSDYEARPHITIEGKCNSPDRSRKPSVKILSTDDSDSDIETVVASRLRKKGARKRWSVQRSRVGLERGKITAALKVGEGKTRPKEKKKENAAVESSSSSEDEGFIEVAIDEDVAIEEDELFPASIFERPAQNVHDNSAKLESPSGTARDRRQESLDRTKGKKGKKEKTMNETKGVVQKTGPRPFDDGDWQTEKFDELNVNHKEGFRSLPNQSKEKSVEANETKVAAAKRKSVLTDILGQLKEKKKRLQEEVGEGGEIGHQVKGSPEMINDNVEVGASSGLTEEVGATGGGFIPEESSDEDNSAWSKERERQDGGAMASGIEASARKFLSHETGRGEHTASLDSDSDEDLKLAKKLSLQTDLSAVGQGIDSELDEDLKLAIQLSLEVSKPGEEAPRHGTETEKSTEEGGSLYQRSTSSFQTVDRSSKSDDDSDGFEDVAETDYHNQKETQIGPRGTEDRLASQSIAQGETDQDRLQPEDFEVDDSESRSYVPALTEYDLSDMRDELESERSALILQQGRQNRMATSVTEQINLDAQDLLRLFGIPFIVSPVEAEAQCAFIEAAGLTEGTITDDSDFWLFGGQRMYKNFFNQNKHVELYTMDNIQNHFSLSREQLINIALLCGSDYTEGLQGVGPVRALEIMAEFPGSGFEGLNKFRQWWDKAKKAAGSLVVENKIRARLKNLTLIPGFPSEAVVDAYLNPTVDESTERFSWASPDLPTLRDFCKIKFGWVKEKSDQTLVPMFKEWSKTQSQGRINSYFGPEAFVQTSKIKSDRLRKALEMVKNPASASQAEGEKVSDRTTSGRSKNNQQLRKKNSKRKQVEDVEELGEEARKTEENQILEKVPENKRSKKVSFVEEVEKNSKDMNGKKSCTKFEDDDGEEERDNDFMINMSGKVRRAKEELDKIKEAQSFACVQKRGGKTGEKRGQTKGKVRGSGKGKIQVGNTTPISLDIARKSGNSRRGRSARGGKVVSSKPAGAVNLSESSSTEDSEEDAASPAGQRIEDTKVKLETKKEQVPYKTSQKPTKTFTDSSMAKRKSGTTNRETEKGTEGKKTSSHLSKLGASEKPSCQSTGMAARQVKGREDSSECLKESAESGPRDLLSHDDGEVFRQARQRKSESYGQRDCKEKASIVKNISLGMSEQNGAATTVAEKAPARSAGEAAGNKKDKDSEGADNLGEIKSGGEVESEAVDMSKADVSVINRRNLPATLAYLNQRSRQDRMLLHQISGKRLHNAVELRMEQEERRQPLVLERVKRKEEEGERMQPRAEKVTGKEEADCETEEEQTCPLSGLSFEDALGGGDLQSSFGSRVKKRKVNSGKERPAQIRGKVGQKTPKTVPQDVTSHTSPGDERKISSEPQRHMLPSCKEITKTTSNILNTDANISSTENLSVGKTLSGKPSTGVRDFSQKKKSIADDLKSSGDSTETTDKIDSFSSMVRKDSEVRPKQNEGDRVKSKGKSKRSQAFDKPINIVGSDDDGTARCPKASFRNQLKHLHESRSVKGHGPLYLSAPGQNTMPSLDVRARAFAGKGKGRGKNRTVEGSGGEGGFVTTEERKQYENITLDDLGSDFSDEGF